MAVVTRGKVSVTLREQIQIRQLSAISNATIKMTARSEVA